MALLDLLLHERFQCAAKATMLARWQGKRERYVKERGGMA